jgi:hypothetical protein
LIPYLPPPEAAGRFEIGIRRAASARHRHCPVAQPVFVEQILCKISVDMWANQLFVRMGNLPRANPHRWQLLMSVSARSDGVAYRLCIWPKQRHRGRLHYEHQPRSYLIVPVGPVCADLSCVSCVPRGACLAVQVFGRLGHASNLEHRARGDCCK